VGTDEESVWVADDKYLNLQALGDFKEVMCRTGLQSAEVLEPVRAGSPGPKWTEARIVGLWLQLMCCAHSVVQPWDFGNGYRLKAKIM
jgi:hypothetical protein